MLAPTRPPAHDELEDLEALIREAQERQRQRRRRLGGVAAVTVLAAVALAAFGIDGTLPRRSAAQSPLTPVVNGPAFAGHGNLAFVSRDRLWLLDGRTRRLVPVAGAGASSPTFSPNGRWLAWAQGPARFGFARSDGTGTHLLPSHDNAPTWLPDGRLLVGKAIYHVARGVPAEAGLAPKGLQSWTRNGTRYAFVEVQPSRHRAGSYNEIERIEISRSLNGPRKLWYETRSRFTTRSGFEGGAIGRVAILPQGGVLVWVDPMHSASLAADSEPVFEIRSPGARPERLGVSLGSPISVGTHGRFALGAGGDRIAWTAKRIITCAGGRCTALRSPRGEMSLEPAWSPDGRTLAYVTAADFGGVDGRATMARWYATRRLRIGGEAVQGSGGAASPVWSSDGRSLLFVARDGLWLLPRLGGRPVRVATPLFWPGRWPNYYGQVDWASQFAWHS